MEWKNTNSICKTFWHLFTKCWFYHNLEVKTWLVDWYVANNCCQQPQDLEKLSCHCQIANLLQKNDKYYDSQLNNVVEYLSQGFLEVFSKCLNTCIMFETHMTCIMFKTHMTCISLNLTKPILKLTARSFN